MKNKSNTLSVDRGNVNSTLTTKMNQEITEKQKNKCYSCGVGLEVESKLHKDGDDLYALCPLCYYPQNLNDVDGNNLIILLPEISQTELNVLQRALAVVDYQIINMIKSIDEGKKVGQSYEISELKDTIDILNIILKERADFADTYYSKGCSNIDIVCNGLQSLSDSEYDARVKGIYGLRMYHDMSMYENHLKYWSVSFNKYKVENWKNLIISTAKRINK